METGYQYESNQFEFIRKLGNGSFSTVKLVKRKSDEKLLALKQICMDRLTMSQKNMALNQVRLLASISSPFVISYHGSFYSSKANSLNLLMEYAEEGDIEKMINKTAQKHKMKRGLEEEFIWKTVIHILQGLRTMHNNKIVHRDLKSANVFLSKGVAKLGDLNVSTVSDSAFYKTKTGTPYYTAPEIWKGQPYSNSCDIWSLGCIIYEMCSLLPPFKASSFPELFILISKGYYEPLSEQYSNDLRTLVRLCLNIIPSQRPNANQLLQNSIITKKQISLETLIGNKENVKIIKEIKCPKRLRFMNEVLPLPLNESYMEKECSLEKKQSFEDKKNKVKSNCSIRIRKQGTMNVIESKKAPKTQKLIKRPSIIDIVNRMQEASMKKEEIELRKARERQQEDQLLKSKKYRIKSLKRIEKENQLK